MYVKVAKDKAGVKFKYPDRECKKCLKYPCFEHMEICVCDMAKYGCQLYSGK